MSLEQIFYKENYTFQYFPLETFLFNNKINYNIDFVE